MKTGNPVMIPLSEVNIQLSWMMEMMMNTF
jgi:hypothetical protein